jgi:threonine-phosphate decarboxylase
MINQPPIHGGQLRQIAERFAIPLSELLDFSSNINPEGPPPAIIPVLRSSLEDPATLGCYPDANLTDLRQSIACHGSNSPGCIAIANGFVPLLDAALQALDIHRCLLPVPAFVEYRMALARAQIKITPYPLASGRDFAYEMDAMVAGEYDANLLANPQNPSGVCCDAQFLVQLVARAAEKSIKVLLDEAFIDYMVSESLSSYVEQFQNLIVFRSVTKFYGIPGLRVAYAIANERTISLVESHLPPWPVSTLAAQAVIAALGDAAYAERTVARNRERRALLQTELHKLKTYTYNSAGNFLLLRLPLGIDTDCLWQRMIVEHHLVLRNCHNYEGLGSRHLRVAVRTELENEVLIEAMRRALPLCRLSGD